MRDKKVSGMGSLSPNCGDKVEEGKEQMNCMNIEQYLLLFDCS